MKKPNFTGTLTGTNETNWIQLRSTIDDFNVSILVGAESSVTAGTISVIYSQDADFENTPARRQKALASLDGMTLIPDDSVVGIINFPVTAIKLVGNGITGGNAEFEITQAAKDF